MIRPSVHAPRLPGFRVLVLGVALVAAVAGCGGGGDESAETSTPSADSSRPEPATSVTQPGTKTFRDDNFGITFQYPDEFRVGEVTSIAQTAGGKPVARAAVALDEDNALFVAKYLLATAVTEQNVADVLPEVDGLVSQLSGQPARGRIVELGGLPTVRYDDVSLTEPADGKSRLAFVFDRNSEYLINCQSTPPARAKVDDACDQALGTLAKS